MTWETAQHVMIRFKKRYKTVISTIKSLQKSRYRGRQTDRNHSLVRLWVVYFDLLFFFIQIFPKFSTVQCSPSYLGISFFLVVKIKLLF